MDLAGDSHHTDQTAANVTAWPGTFGVKRDARFANTRWTIVLNAKEGMESQARSQALSELCQNYWYPLYAYVRRSGHDRDSAQDLTQEFFAKLIEDDVLASASKERGKLRTFLLTVMKRFLIKEWKRGQAEKRGGGIRDLPLTFDDGEERYSNEPCDNATPDELYEKHWATTLLGKTLSTLEREYADRDMQDRYDALKECLWWNAQDTNYSHIGDALGLSVNAVKQAVSRMRRQYRTLLKEEIRSTIDSDDDDDVSEELGNLIAILRGSS